MKTVEVKGYVYRHFDTMLIVLTADNKLLYLFCPSETIYNDGKTRFYCYKSNMLEHSKYALDSVTYTEERENFIQCDGVAKTIFFNMEKARKI